MFLVAKKKKKILQNLIKGDAGVNHSVHQVGNENANQRQHSRNHTHRHDNIEIIVHNRIEHPPAHAVNAENDFDNH